ncbi:hypothetical protein BKA60DRAFT_542091 [Fusarium oxysporum]|nr:hypothetical protein BKA60DRAFT_542091 [Fusarium oxysporum]
MPTLKPLPDCEGPKLERFTNDLTKHDFKFLEYLGSGCHSVVVKAEIDGKIYVIKLFFPVYVHEPNFELDPIDEDYFVEREEKERLTASEKIPQHVVDSLRVHATSFYNECRAYGRLKELGREHLAGKVHGYLRLYLHQIDEQVQDAIKNTIPEAKWPTIQVMEMMDDEVDLPIMAILHKCGIVVRDLKSQQYYEGQLCDLSHAWAIPHVFGPEGGIRPSWAFASMAAWDLKCFHDMIEEANESALRAEPPLKPSNSVAKRNDERYESLRPRLGMQRPFLPMLNYDEGGTWDLNYYPSYDPALFKWKTIPKRTKEKPIGHIPKKPIGGVSIKRKSTATEEAQQMEKGKSMKRKR